MKQLFLYLILFIFFTFTEEKISYKSNNNVYSYYKNGQIIEFFIENYDPQKEWDYPLNAQYCRLNDPSKSELESVSSSNLEELEGSKCCYISILESKDNPDWYHFCGRVSSTNYKKKVSEYIEELNNNENIKNKFKKIKIDCFSKRIYFMIIILITNLVYLI